THAVAHMSGTTAWRALYRRVTQRAIEQAASINEADSGHTPVLDVDNTLQNQQWLDAHEARVKLSARRLGFIVDAAVRAGVVDAESVSSDVVYEFLAQSSLIEAILHATTKTQQEPYP